MKPCLKNAYTLHIYQVGSPGFPFGSVTTQIAVKDSRGWTQDKKTFELCNDGSGVWVEYTLLDIRWEDSAVEVEMRGIEEEKSTVHILKLS